MGSGDGSDEEQSADEYWRGLRKYCLGFMGMTPREYDCILYVDLIAKMEGFNDRMRWEEGIMRKVAFSAYVAPHVNPKKMPRKIETFWPMSGGNTNTKKITDERRERLKLALKRYNDGKAGT